MSERLYLANPYLTRFEARVARQARLGTREAVVLDRTAFYPEGGGQPADRGTLGGVAVVDVQEQDGEILHALDGPAPSGRVEGLVDWPRRFDHIQQHHGQHLLSAAFERLLGGHTLSFHLGETTSSIDLDLPAGRLDERALREVEAAANQSVWRDLPVTAREFPPEELARLPLRKEPVKGARVVVVGDLPGEPGGLHPPGLVDASPCGGTHPRRTGEVGAVAVLGARKWGEGARVEFACGGRVVRALADAAARLGAAAQALRCAPAEVGEAAGRVAEESQARRKEVERLVAALADTAGDRLAAAGSGPVAARLEPPLSGAAGLKAVAASLAARGRVALLGGVDGGRAFLCFARPKGPGSHLGDLVREAAAAVGGKGGGAPDLAQGSGPEAARLAEALDLARARLGATDEGGERR